MAQDSFYQDLPLQRDFADLTRAEHFQRLPKDWLVGCCDIVDSTTLIANGRYKTVNMIGASVISAMINTLEGRAFPYVFGGDGASFAVAAEDANRTRKVLAQLCAWVSSEFQVELRAALLPVTWIRSEGLDVRVARHAASDGVDYAMFTGGGLAWAEQQMKAGAFAVAPALELAPPDLTGLSCRWNNIQSQNGTILSLVMVPGAQATEFAEVATRIVELAEQIARGGHPVPLSGPGLQYPPASLALEARVSRGTRPFLLRSLQLLASTLWGWAFFKTGIKAGDFDPTHYRAAVSSNADFRKFDDGLKMTLDCDPGNRKKLLDLLEQAQKAGQVRYGLHEQDEAMVTCIVPSVTRGDHVHFVDGAAGGYTQAAAQIKNWAVDTGPKPVGN